MNSTVLSIINTHIKSRQVQYTGEKNHFLNKLLVLFAAIILLGSTTYIVSYACPALETPRMVTQPSGEKFKATLHGDEWFSYTVAQTGDLIIKGSDGYWYYGVAEKDGLKKSSSKYKINSKPAHAQTIKDVDNLRKVRLSKFKKTYGTPVPNRSFGFSQSQNNLSHSMSANTMAVSGTQKVLVLLVSFTNVSIVNSDSAWSNEFFGDTGKTLKTFYKEMSQNNFYFAPATESKGTANDGVVRVTLSYAHPNTGETTDDRNKNIVINAVNAADAYVNFSLFDTNSDGIITASELHIITVVSGNDCSYGDSAPSIWPHSWSTDDYMYKDGKNIYGDYTQIAEKQGGHMATMGVVAHELGHDLGLPDLYDTDYSSDGIGIYSLMASGSWGTASGEYEGASPTHMDAWCKIQLGFAAPVTAAAGSYSMNSVTNGGYTILKITTSDPNQYFLVENRQTTGFDAGMAYYDISSGGIAIYHIDMSVTTDNDVEAHKLVDLEEANEVAYGGRQLDDNNSKDRSYNNLFRAGTNTMFSYGTMPNSALYSGVDTNISIGVPGAYSGSMTVNINIHSIAFNSNGGSAVTVITQPTGTIIQKPADPSKTGYAFVGWYYDTGLTAAVTWPYTLGTTDVMFYAKWINRCTITFNSYGGSSISDITQPAGTSIQKPADPAKAYNTFGGWYSDAGLTAAVTWPYTLGSADVVFYAKWSIDRYTITFDSNGGSSVASITQNYNTSIEKPADPVMTGFTFDGWYSNTGLVTWPFILDSEDLIFYANWSRDPVTLDAKANSTAIIKEDEHFIYGLKEGMNSAELITSFINVNGDGHINIYPLNAGNLGTGTRIDLIDNVTDSVIASYYIVIFGDVNGDGNIDSIDAGVLVDYENYRITWNPATDAALYKAGDVNGDGNVDSIDAGVLVDVENYRKDINQVTGLAAVY